MYNNTAEFYLESSKAFTKIMHEHVYWKESRYKQQSKLQLERALDTNAKLKLSFHIQWHLKILISNTIQIYRNVKHVESLCKIQLNFNHN